MDFQGGLIVLIIFVSLFAIWLIFYFIPDRTLVLGVGVGREDQPAAA